MQNNKIDTILLIAPSIHMGGMQNSIVNLANNLANSGLFVEMYAIFKLEHFFKLDIRIKFSESPKSPQCYNLITRILSIIFNIRKIAKRSKSQTIIVYGKFYSALTLLATVGLRKRVFISDRASPLYHGSYHGKLLTNMIFFFIKPYGIIAQTNISAKYQCQQFGKNIPIEVIPNFVREIKKYDCNREKIVLAVGRFGDKLKGFDRLIEAWGKVNSPDWKLIFAGGSEYEDPGLGNRAKVLGVYDTIIFLGKVSNMDILYAKSSIFVIPSRSEGFPNALIEAMCAGLACISFDFIAGPRDIIEDKVNGLLVPEGDIDMLAIAIRSLINNPQLRSKYSSNAESLKTHFETKKIINKFINFISCGL